MSASQGAGGASNGVTAGGNLFETEDDDGVDASRAIQVVAQGQRSENLLDFGGDDDEMNGLGTSSNFLAGPRQDAPLGASLAQQEAELGGLDFGPGGQASRGNGAGKSAAKSANPLDDLLGLFDSAGLGPGSAPAASTTPMPASLNGLGAGSATTSQPSPARTQPAHTQGKIDMDLMGDLF